MGQELRTHTVGGVSTGVESVGIPASALLQAAARPGSPPHRPARGLVAEAACCFQGPPEALNRE